MIKATQQELAIEVDDVLSYRGSKYCETCQASYIERSQQGQQTNNEADHDQSSVMLLTGSPYHRPTSLCIAAAPARPPRVGRIIGKL